MAVSGQAAVVAFDAPVVVVIEPSAPTRAALALAGGILPLGLFLAWLATDDTGPFAGSTRLSLALAALTAVVLLAGAVALASGTVRARLLVDNREVDRVGWSLRPRRLKATVGTHALEVEIEAGTEREVSFLVDGALLKKLPLV
jgi:hypothetical protein